MRPQRHVAAPISLNRSGDLLEVLHRFITYGKCKVEVTRPN